MKSTAEQLCLDRSVTVLKEGSGYVVIIEQTLGTCVAIHYPICSF